MARMLQEYLMDCYTHGDVGKCTILVMLFNILPIKNAFLYLNQNFCNFNLKSCFIKKCFTFELVFCDTNACFFLAKNTCIIF